MVGTSWSEDSEMVPEVQDGWEGSGAKTTPSVVVPGVASTAAQTLIQLEGAARISNTSWPLTFLPWTRPPRSIPTTPDSLRLHPLGLVPLVNHGTADLWQSVTQSGDFFGRGRPLTPFPSFLLRCASGEEDSPSSLSASSRSLLSPTLLLLLHLAALRLPALSDQLRRIGNKGLQREQPGAVPPFSTRTQPTGSPKNKAPLPSLAPFVATPTSLRILAPGADHFEAEPGTQDISSNSGSRGRTTACTAHRHFSTRDGDHPTDQSQRCLLSSLPRIDNQ